MLQLDRFDETRCRRPDWMPGGVRDKLADGSVWFFPKLMDAVGRGLVDVARFLAAGPHECDDDLELAEADRAVLRAVADCLRANYDLSDAEARWLLVDGFPGPDRAAAMARVWDDHIALTWQAGAHDN